MWLTNISEIVGSIAPLVTIYIAYRALGIWRRTLHHQRIDECISAAVDLEGLVGRLVTVKNSGGSGTSTEASGQMWAGWLRLNRAYFVARRYCEPPLDPDATKKIGEALYELKGADRVADGTKDQIYKIINKLISELERTGTVDGGVFGRLFGAKKTPGGTAPGT
jgi:hypothetical protein